MFGPQGPAVKPVTGAAVCAWRGVWALRLSWLAADTSDGHAVIASGTVASRRSLPGDAGGRRLESGLEAVKVVHCALCVRRRREDCALVLA